jgi:hypothetical protein
MSTETLETVYPYLLISGVAIMIIGFILSWMDLGEFRFQGPPIFSVALIIGAFLLASGVIMTKIISDRKSEAAQQLAKNDMLWIIQQTALAEKQILSNQGTYSENLFVVFRVNPKIKQALKKDKYEAKHLMLIEKGSQLRFKLVRKIPNPNKEKHFFMITSVAKIIPKRKPVVDWDVYEIKPE